MSFNSMINTVIQGDCLKVMKEMPDGCVDLVVTDPPYGIGLDYGDYIDSLDNLKYLVSVFMPEVLRISNVTLLTCGITNQWLYPIPKWVMAWSYAPSTNKITCWGFNQWQPILVYGNDPYLANRLGARPDMIHDMKPPKRNHSHPCPKPLSFMEKLIIRASVNKTDIILDPFAGSGTTLVAAKNLGRRYIGIELEPKYVEICNQRLAQGVLKL